MRISIAATAFVLLTACPQPSAPPTTPDDGGTVQRPQLTVEACELQGGRVIGDIGDGAIHRPDYRCPDSGKAPIGTIVADPDGPIWIEGAVCCK